MLQLNTVHKNTFKLLQELQKMPVQKKFALAGGTALALQMGHRISVDLDFFTKENFDTELIIEDLQKHYSVNDISKAPNSLSCFIVLNNSVIKTEWLRHHYPNINKAKLIDNIRMYSIQDISAMKLNAINNRGTKKDFIDLFFLLKKMQFTELIDYYKKKYTGHNIFMLLKSLTYFEDADSEPHPLMLQYTEWEEVKSKISAAVKKHVDELQS